MITCSSVAQSQLSGPVGLHLSQSVSLLASPSLLFSTEDHHTTTLASQPERESSSPFSRRYPHRWLRHYLPLLEQLPQSRCSATGDTVGWVPGPRAPKHRRTVQILYNWRHGTDLQVHCLQTDGYSPERRQLSSTFTFAPSGASGPSRTRLKPNPEVGTRALPKGRCGFR